MHIVPTYATVCEKEEINYSKAIVYQLNLNELHMDHRTRIIILCETCLSVLQSQQVADIVNILSTCIFCFQSSFFLVFVTIKTASDDLLPTFLVASPGKHTDTCTFTNKISTT